MVAQRIPADGADDIDDVAPSDFDVTKHRSASNCDGEGIDDKFEEYLEQEESGQSATSVSTDCSSIVSSALNEAPFIHDESPANCPKSFLLFRLNYLLVTTVIMLADGLQGTHLYVLYEGYGYSVASLYCLGFLTGAVTTPITGPMIDKFGRKKSAIIYCILEIAINQLEQFPFLTGLIFSRMVGGITTNLLASVFEAWLDTEHRRRGFNKEQYEILMRDSVVVSNLAAIASGYMAHVLAEQFGPVGPFEGAVGCTSIALLVVFFAWTENYGSNNEICGNADNYDGEILELSAHKSVTDYMKDVITAFRSDPHMLRVSIIQGLSIGSLQIFVFLWSPALQFFAKNATLKEGTLGLDGQGEPAYGLIFGAFMAAGVFGGLLSPSLRKVVSTFLSPSPDGTIEDLSDVHNITINERDEIRPMAVDFLAAGCYLCCAGLFMIPCFLTNSSPWSFSIALFAFILYEVFVGIFLPCEGAIRSLYIPSESRASMMALPRIIVNVAVSIGVVLTNFISVKAAFGIIATLMLISCALQISLVSKQEWDSLFGNIDIGRKRVIRSLSFRNSSSSSFLSSKTNNKDNDAKEKIE